MELTGRKSHQDSKLRSGRLQKPAGYGAGENRWIGRVDNELEMMGSVLLYCPCTFSEARECA